MIDSGANLKKTDCIQKEIGSGTEACGRRQKASGPYMARITDSHERFGEEL